MLDSAHVKPPEGELLQTSAVRGVTGVSMNRQGMLNTLEEGVSIFFLAAGPVLGVAIALAWVLGLILGLFAVLTR